MAKYTITVDESTQDAKSLVKYLRCLGVLEEANDITLSAVSELKTGKVTRCESFDDYLISVKNSDFSDNEHHVATL